MPGLTSAGSQATTRHRPGRPPMEESIVKMASGERLCASISAPSSVAGWSAGSTSSTVTVPGSSPRGAASTSTNRSQPLSSS